MNILAIKKSLALLLCTFILASCASTKTYKDAGVYRGENYVFDVTWVDEGLFRTTYISINGDLVLKIDLQAVQAANCYKTSPFVSRCIYNTTYQNKVVEVIADLDGQMYQQNSYYSVSFNGTLIRRITVPIR